MDIIGPDANNNRWRRIIDRKNIRHSRCYPGRLRRSDTVVIGIADGIAGPIESISRGANTRSGTDMSPSGDISTAMDVIDRLSADIIRDGLVTGSDPADDEIEATRDGRSIRCIQKTDGPHTAEA